MILGAPHPNRNGHLPSRLPPTQLAAADLEGQERGAFHLGRLSGRPPE